MCLSDSNAAIRPLCDSRYGMLHARKLSFINDGGHSTIRLAGLWISRPAHDGLLRRDLDGNP